MKTFESETIFIFKAQMTVQRVGSESATRGVLS